jgi:thiol-disulfide isomerase/thioredoxin
LLPVTDGPHEVNAAPRRVRWYFPAMFAVSAVAAAIAVIAWTYSTRTAAPAGSPSNLSALAGGAPEQGAPAPDFTVPTVDGGTLSLAAHLATDGRPVFLNLWATWCPPCRAEMPLIDEAATANPGVRFVGVAVRDDRAAVEEFVVEIGVGYDIAIDDGDQVWDAYPVLGMPGTFVIDGGGTIVGSHIGILAPETIEQLIGGLSGS